MTADYLGLQTHDDKIEGIVLEYNIKEVKS
jgi:hypothetical protein